tara:strand:+ start:575 stop:688 length:114 start_codon:yes stop_codon:yes gene_type:complete
VVVAQELPQTMKDREALAAAVMALAMPQKLLEMVQMV